MPQFQYIEFLLLLIIIPLLVAIFLYALAKKKAIGKKIGDPLLVKELSAGYSAPAFLKKFILIVFAFGILVLVLANPRSAASEQKISRNGIDIMFALDVSKSMLAQDIKPSRLDRAKQVLSRLVDKLDNDRIGIVIFAGKAYLQMPLTADHAAAKMYLSSATTESVPSQGTVIGDALNMCNASFNAKEKKYKAVVLISDGEDHDGQAVKIAEEIAALGVTIFTVGIGSPQGAPLIDETTNEWKKDNDGNTVISKLNESGLQSIAQKGNGLYVLFNNTDAVVSTITSQLSNLDQRNVTDDSLVNYKSYFQYFLGIAFLFLLVEIFITERKKLKNDYFKLKPTIAVLLLFTSNIIFAQDDKASIKKGNEAYQRKDFTKASEAYTDALKKNPLNPVAQYNLGNALYKCDKKDEAVAAYDHAVKRLNAPGEISNAYYNKGVVLQNDEKLGACITAYKNSLKIDPGNEDARQNLQRALLQQRQEQQKKQQKKQDQQQQQKKPEPRPQPSKLTREDAENKLKALSQQEKNLQDKLHKVNNVSVNNPEKDW
ncbi:MAG: VWA domain-containing protein [Ferruginibacter sp.]|nr:VWA domain-containing protein [Ferruginibacter sp.]